MIPRSEILWTFFYATLVFIRSIGQFVAVTLVPVSCSQSIEMTMSIASGIVLFAIFWEENITFRRVGLALMCAVGVILVIQPEFIFHHQTHKPNVTHVTATNSGCTGLDTNKTMECDHHGNKPGNLVVIGYILPFAAGTSISISLLVLKRRPFLRENVFEVLFWTFVCGMIFSLLPMLIVEDPVLPRNWIEFGFVAGHCLTYVLTIPATMYATRYVSGNTMNIVMSTTVVFMLVSQYTVLSSIHPGNRNWIEVLGVVLVLMGASLGSMWELLTSE